MIRNSNSTNGHIEFVSYTGKYPNLCGGVLTLIIDGREEKFGHEYNSYDFKTSSFRDNNYSDFWSSGGFCGLRDHNECVKDGEWIINKDDLPESFRKYAEEIDRVFNDNVPHGCCGGCL